MEKVKQLKLFWKLTLGFGNKIELWSRVDSLSKLKICEPIISKTEKKKEK